MKISFSTTETINPCVTMESQNDNDKAQLNRLVNHLNDRYMKYEFLGSEENGYVLNLPLASTIK